MGTLSASDQYIDPKQKTEIYYGYHQEHYNCPQATPGYPISKYYQSQDNYPSVHTHETNYPTKPGSPYPYPAYYYTHQQQTLIQEPSPTTTTFNRLMLILMTVLIGCMCMMSLVMWFLYGTYIPEFEVSSLKVSNFTASNGALTGTWDANLVVRNTNEDLTIDFQSVRSVILYRGNILGISSVQSFEIQKNGKLDLSFKVPVDEKGMDVDSLVMHALDHDWSNGVVFFSLRMAMRANFSSTDRGYKQQGLTVSCDELEINSSPARSEGRLNRGMRSQCLISLL